MNIFYNKSMELLAVNRVAFNIFGMDIYWYGIIISFAILVAYVLSLYLVKVRNLNKDLSFEVLIFAIPLGIVFARLVAVLFDNSLSITDYFNFRTGGMSIIGAIIGGVIGIVLLKIIKKRSILDSFDLIATVLLLSQAIGRWGNFFNSEIYGFPVTNPDLQFFPFAVMINGEYFEALFFYEFVLNIIGFIGLFIIYKKTQIKGLSTAGYLIYYGVVRSILEPRRQAKYILEIFGAPFSLISSILMIVAGVALLIFVLVKHFKSKKLGVKNGR